jgi:hypothetical protein
MVDFKALAAPFDPREVLWRVGSVTKDKTKAMALAYVDARVVMDRLDAICGPAGWQCKYSHANGKTVCDIGILSRVESDGLGGHEWIWKADGAGDSDIEAEKGALSDAFKRAAVRWGIGRYLYEVDSPWVEIDEWKRIKQGEYKKLDMALRRHTQAILNPAPSVAKADPLAAAKDDIAAAQNRGEQPIAEASGYDKTKAANAKKWADTAIGAIKLASHPSEVDEWQAENAKALDRLEANFPDEHKRVMAACASERDRCSAKVAA